MIWYLVILSVVALMVYNLDRACSRSKSKSAAVEICRDNAKIVWAFMAVGILVLTVFGAYRFATQARM